MAEDAGFTAEENAALQSAIDKPIGKLFGGAGQGTSLLKLKAAAAGGPLAEDAWNEVRTDHAALLGDKTDAELAAAFVLLDEAQLEKKSSSATTSKTDALSGVAPLAAAAVVAFAVSTLFGGGCDSQYANAAACAERAERAAGKVQETPLARYRDMAVASSSDSLKAFERPTDGAPRTLMPADLQKAAGNIADADFWKGKKK